MKKTHDKNSLLSRWKNRDSKSANSDNFIKKAPTGIRLPLSPGQKRLWFLQLMYPKNHFYNYSETYTFHGILHKENLFESLRKVYNDHDILKTTYHIENDEIFQLVDNNSQMDIEFHDISNFNHKTVDSKVLEIIQKHAFKYFDLERSPLVRASIIKLSENKHILQITLHHIITDKWSMRIFRDHLAEYYLGFSSSKPINNKREELQYLDFAYWLNSKKVITKNFNYWKQRLSRELPILNLPTDFKRPQKPTFAGSTSSVLNYNQELSNKIFEIAEQHKTTAFNVMLAAYYVLLYKYSGQTDICVGTPVTNRDHKVLEEMIGFFNDTLVLRTQINPNVSFKEFLQDIRENTLTAFEHKDISFDYLVKELNIERSLSVNPLFQVMFLFHSKPKNPYFGEDLKMSHTWYDLKVSKFDLTIYIAEEDGLLSTTFEYTSDLFRNETVENLLKDYKSILEKATFKMDLSISNLIFDTNNFVKIEPNKKTNKFLKFNAIHNIIEDEVLNHPNKIAVTDNEVSITYLELNNRANAIAKKILEKQSSNSQIVGLCIERSINIIIGLLGILKAGYAYLPIDPEYPKQRLNFMFGDAKVDTIVSQSSLLNLFDEFEINHVLIDKIDGSQYDNAIELPIVKETDLAYVIYTSGSTGKPKGVPITHKNIINSTAGRLDFYDENPSAFLLMSSISFDSSKAGIFWTLCTGGNLVIAEKRIEQDLFKIARTIEKHKVSHTLMLPSLYKVILENVEIKKLESLTAVMVAGEACPKSLCKIHFKTLPKVTLYNEYGPTEASVWCIAHKIEVSDLEKDQIPIGKPVANSQVYLLDDDKNIVPFGTSGEIYIAGDGLSKGYLNRVELTDRAFVENPFNPNKKLYKTGDLAKYRNDGSIEFLGRVDQQIKIRGYRVELESIENTINKSTLVKQSVVLVKQDEDKPKRLIAYVKPSNLFDENQLKLQLKEVLPDYMIPSSFILIDSIPRLPNGKVDKKSLSKIDVESKSNEGNSIKKPQNDIEQKLLNIWEDILNIKPLSVTDNFFEIGGDSILSIQIIAKARKAGLVISPNQLFEHQTISELAMFVSLESEIDKVIETMTIGNVPLFPIQKWFFDTHQTAPQFWNQIFKIQDLPKTVNKNSLYKITSRLIEIHDALRLSFYFKGDKWQAKILKPKAINPFITVDITDEKPQNFDSKIETSLKDIQENMMLEKGNLFKCIYFETGNNATNTIMLLAHHLVIDFVSWQIILNYYTDNIYSDNFPKKMNKTASIKTWGNHLLELSNSKNITNEIDFWKTQMANKISLPKDYKSNLPLLEKEVSYIYYEVEKTITNNLIHNANNAYNTKIDELLLTALIDTFNTWTNKKSITIAMERHGRETIKTNIDLSNTVGWFTAFFPKTFNFELTTDLASKIITTKEQMRQIPNGGVGYGILRYLTSSLGNAEYPEIVFNFLGKQSTSENNIASLSKNTRHPHSERHYYLEINALIKDGVLSLNWSYSNKIHKTETIETLIHNFNESLKNIVTHCVNSDTVKYTPSDFEDVDLDQDDIDNLLNDLDF